MLLSWFREALVCDSKTRSILRITWLKKHKWLRHILSHGGFLHDITEGKMMGKPTQGRKRKVFGRYNGMEGVGTTVS